MIIVSFNTNININFFLMSLRRKLAAFAIANLLALPLMSGIVSAQITTNQDRTVVTLDVANLCETGIEDTLPSGVTRDSVDAADRNAHDEDDIIPSGLGDGFDQVPPSPTIDGTDSSDSGFSNLTIGTFDASSSNIVVDDPDYTDLGVDDGHGYVDLTEFDPEGNGYAAVFNALVKCDTTNGYDLHIADTFNLETTASGVAPVDYNSNDIIFDGNGDTRIVRREGLFRIAPDSDRDVDANLDGFNAVKHEYILDLPSEEITIGTQCDDMTNDDLSGGDGSSCEPVSLDPFGIHLLRQWPYAFDTPPADTNFGTVGFTLLCDQGGGVGTVTSGAGRINPYTRGISVSVGPALGELSDVFLYEDGNDDCDDVQISPEEYYAAIPSLVDDEDYQGISGDDPGTYAAILSANNWVGYSGTILPANLNTASDNFFEVRASVPNNQMAGTYAGTIILSCLPNLTLEPELDFDGPFGTPAWSGDDP